MQTFIYRAKETCLRRFFHNIDDKVTQGIYINLLRILNEDPFKQRNCFNKIYVM